MKRIKKFLDFLIAFDRKRATAGPLHRRVMVLLDYVVYRETRQIVLGRSRRSPMLAEFSDWLMRTYSVKMLNIEFSQLLGSKTNKYRLMLVIESQKDYQKIHALLLGPAEEAKRPITDEFRRLALKYQLTADEQLRDIFVTCVDFSNEAMTDANWNAANEVKRRIKRKYPVVWDIRPMFSGSVVFYYSDFDVTINENKGISAAITNDYYSILKKYDELNYFTRENSMLKFDSKENFDKTYKGNFYYYMH